MSGGFSEVQVEISTPHGPARAHLQRVTAPRGALVLGHGAGGGIAAGDLVAASRAARSERLSIALVEQPYRVAGRRSPAPAKQLDAAWVAVVRYLLAHQFRGLRLITGGRSAGARVACRTALDVGALAVLCLAFPLRPPRRSGSTGSDSRLSELEQAGVPVLVVQGDRDPFGLPPTASDRIVVPVRGDHSLRSDTDGVARAVADWLPDVLARAPGQRSMAAGAPSTPRRQGRA